MYLFWADDRLHQHLFHVPPILTKAAPYLAYFYGMQQLDLFGFPIETPAPKKKEKAVKATNTPGPIAENTEPDAPVVNEMQAIGPVTSHVTETEVPVENIVEEVAAPEISSPQPIAEENTFTQVYIHTEEPKAEITTEPVTTVTKAASVKKVTATKQAGKRGRKSFKEMDNEADLIEVPEDDVLKQKLYYSISEVASWFKVNTSLLRYWENEFDVLQPRKTRKGDRLFRVEDVKNLQLIYFLLRQRKFSIDGAKNYLKNNKQEADTQIRLVESLTKFKSFLLELKANLQA